MTSISTYEPTNEFNSGHILEALDRCYTVEMLMCNLLDEHPAIVKCGASDDIKQVIDTIGVIYQKVGSLRD